MEPFSGSTGSQHFSQPTAASRFFSQFSIDSSKMCDGNQPKQQSEAEAELEQEIRKGRKFTLEEGIMRLAGPGMMKGESPVSRREQSESMIESYVRRHLLDPEGALPLVLFRRVNNSDLLLANLDQPLVVLATYIQKVLDSEYLQAELVREADAEWGRLLGERPFFERAGAPPHPDDPYTTESVRFKLTQLLEKLNAGDLQDS